MVQDGLQIPPGQFEFRMFLDGFPQQGGKGIDGGVDPAVKPAFNLMLSFLYVLF